MTKTAAVRPYLLTPYQQPDPGLLEKREDEDDGATERTTGPTVLGTVVEQVKPAARPVRQIWLPPLPVACTPRPDRGETRPSARAGCSSRLALR